MSAGGFATVVDAYAPHPREERKTILAALKPRTLLARVNTSKLERVAQEVRDMIVKIMKDVANDGNGHAKLAT